MIIKTKRPASILLVDTIITAAAWLAFIYQFTQGIVFLLSEHPGVPLSSYFGITLSPATTTLTACLIICLFNAALVYAWGRWQKTRRSNTVDVPMVQPVPPSILADHFSLSPQQLDDVRGSRVTVVYHSNSGGITHLETSDLQLQQVSPSYSESALRVA